MFVIMLHRYGSVLLLGSGFTAFFVSHPSLLCKLSIVADVQDWAKISKAVTLQLLIPLSKLPLMDSFIKIEWSVDDHRWLDCNHIPG